jgi:hypothetical protein
MFSNYLASQKDFQAIEEALRFALHPKMKFVFEDFSRIKNTLVVSYNSKFIYIWKLESKKLEYKIPHKIVIEDEWQSGWRAGISIAQIENLLPDLIKNKSRFEIPIISGGQTLGSTAGQQAG